MIMEHTIIQKTFFKLSRNITSEKINIGAWIHLWNRKYFLLDRSWNDWKKFSALIKRKSEMQFREYALGSILNKYKWLFSIF